MNKVDFSLFSAGIFPVDKPAGSTSFAVVQKVRQLLGVKKVGHAGTLDPFATGLLIICAGRPATRYIDDFMAGQKTYQAVVQLGQETATQDPEGEVIAVKPVPEMNTQDVAEVLREFIGPQMQAPPPYSAAKYKGKPLYYYARKGIMIKKEPKPIEIYSLEVDSYDSLTSCLTFTVSCSRGTYIRVLAEDIGRKIGCGGYLTALRRTHSGGFAVGQAVDGEQLFSDKHGPSALARGMLTVEQALERCRRPVEQSFSHSSVL